jgi:hypothetical protein
MFNFSGPLDGTIRVSKLHIFGQRQLHFQEFVGMPHPNQQLHSGIGVLTGGPH